MLSEGTSLVTLMMQFVFSTVYVHSNNNILDVKTFTIVDIKKHQ